MKRDETPQGDGPEILAAIAAAQALVQPPRKIAPVGSGSTPQSTGPSVNAVIATAQEQAQKASR